MSNKIKVRSIQPIRTLFTSGRGLHNILEKNPVTCTNANPKLKLCKGYQQRGLQDEYQPCIPSGGSHKKETWYVKDPVQVEYHQSKKKML